MAFKIDLIHGLRIAEIVLHWDWHKSRQNKHHQQIEHTWRATWVVLTTVPTGHRCTHSIQAIPTCRHWKAPWGEWRILPVKVVVHSCATLAMSTWVIQRGTCWKRKNPQTSWNQMPPYAGAVSAVCNHEEKARLSPLAATTRWTKQICHPQLPAVRPDLRWWSAQLVRVSSFLSDARASNRWKAPLKWHITRHTVRWWKLDFASFTGMKEPSAQPQDPGLANFNRHFKMFKKCHKTWHCSLP